MMNASETGQRLRSVCEKHEVERLSLFGSALREDFDPDSSDLDFAVVFREMSGQRHADAYFGLAEDLEVIFRRSVDLVEVSAVRNPYLRSSIETSQRTIYGAA